MRDRGAAAGETGREGHTSSGPRNSRKKQHEHEHELQQLELDRGKRNHECRERL